MPSFNYARMDMGVVLSREIVCGKCVLLNFQSVLLNFQRDKQQ